MRLSFLLIFSYTTVANDVLQPELITAKVGHNVTLTCFSRKDEVTYIAWFKQQVVEKPRIMAKAFSYSEAVELQGEFKTIMRFSFQRTATSFNLTIANVEPSDSAVYYCATMSFNEIDFGDGTLLMLTDYNERTVVQQPVSDPVHPGDSVTLNCTVDSKTCAGKHSVYWFRHGSGESLLGLLYTHGKRSDECEKISKARSPTRSCVYSLPKRILSRSDAGTYYCAVVTCGNILFGNGTELTFPGENAFLLHAVYSLGTTLALCVILIIILICLLNKRTHNQNCREGQRRMIAPDEQNSEADSASWVPLNFTGTEPKARSKKTLLERKIVYSTVNYEVLR